MKHKEVITFHSYQLPSGEWKKHGIVTELEEGDTPRDVFYAQKKIINDFFFESKGHDEKQLAADKVVVGKVMNEEAKNIAEILLCKDQVALKEFALMAKSSKSKALKSAFNQKSNELNNKKKVNLP